MAFPYLDTYRYGELDELHGNGSHEQLVQRFGVDIVDTLGVTTGMFASLTTIPFTVAERTFWMAYVNDGFGDPADGFLDSIVLLQGGPLLLDDGFPLEYQ